MNIISLDQLSEIHLSHLNKLLAKCSRQASATVYYPGWDAVRHYLLYLSEEELISVLAVCPAADGGPDLECTAYTLPDKRRQGYFAHLLSACVHDFPDTDLTFAVNHHDADALSTMAALDAECLSTEYLMTCELELKKGSTSAYKHPDGTLTPADDGMWLFFSAADELVGQCRLTAFNQNFCLSDFEIKSSYRRMGYGTAMLLMLFQQLPTAVNTSIFLHVSKSNLAAVTLYKKTGFRITETLSYFLY